MFFCARKKKSLENGSTFSLLKIYAKQHSNTAAVKQKEEKRGARLAGKCNRQATLAEAEQARFLSPPEKFG